MSYYVYILYSESFDCYYKGHTQNLKERLLRHNAGLEKSTARYKPWKLMWYTEKGSRSEAMKLEAKLKNLSRDQISAFTSKYRM